MKRLCRSNALHAPWGSKSKIPHYRKVSLFVRNDTPCNAATTGRSSHVISTVGRNPLHPAFRSAAWGITLHSNKQLRQSHWKRGKFARTFRTWPPIAHPRAVYFNASWSPCFFLSVSSKVITSCRRPLSASSRPARGAAANARCRCSAALAYSPWSASRSA